LDFAKRIALERNYELFLEESLNGGKQVLLSLKVEDFKVGDDTITDQISLINSFDKSTGLCLSFVNKTARCKNIFSRVLKNKFFSINHDSLMADKMEEVIQKLEMLNNIRENHKINLEEFVSTKLSKDLALTYLSRSLDMNIDIESDDLNFSLEYNEAVSTRKKNQFDRMVQCYEQEAVDLGNTVYTLYNTASRYCTHVLNKPYTGRGVKLSNNIYQSCLNLVH
jgi:hypothetical protein